jgi:adenylyltransferase/sulfurtransferase
MKEIGIDGQRKLKAAKVLIVGAGGLGSPAALYLAGVGIGTIGLVDGDVVEETNLHRQVIHSEERLGVHKV